MTQTKRLILRIACVVLTAVCVLLLLQLAKIAPPVGVGWGDAVRGRAYSVGLDGEIVFETLSGMNVRMPGGFAIGVDTLGRFDGFGIHYHRYNLVTLGPDQKPMPGVYGTKGEERVSAGWPIVLLLAVVWLYRLTVIRERRAARARLLCGNCGYDLRATPDRCPECGLVPAAAAGGQATGGKGE